MKHGKSIFIVFGLILCLTSCAKQPPESPSSDLPAAAPSGVPVSAAFPSPEIVWTGMDSEENAVLRLPDLTRDMRAAVYNSMQIYDVEETIPLEYEITSPPHAFFTSMERMRDEEYARLLDQTNFLYTEDYAVFRTYDARDAQYKIVMVDGMGKTRILFSTSQEIRSLKFYDRDKLIVELREIQYYEGSGMRCYVIDLAQETMEVLYDHLLVDSMFGTYYWYDGHLIVSGGNAGPYLWVDNLNLVLEDGTAVVLAEKADYETVRFDRGKMFYTLYEETENSKLYSMDLGTFERETVYTFPGSEPNLFYVRNGKVFIENARYESKGGVHFKINGQNLTVYDIETRESVTLALSVNHHLDPEVSFPDDALIWLDADTNVLWQTGFNGESTKLLENLNAYSFAYFGDTIYIDWGMGYIWKANLAADPIVLESVL